MVRPLTDIANLLFPKVCPGCQRPLLKSENELCIHCQTGLPVRLHLTSGELIQRFYGRVLLTEAHTFLSFSRNGLAQRILHEIKYGGNRELAIEMGRLFGEKCSELELYKSIDVIVPVPLHDSKLRLRGFNQSELIAKGLGEKLGVPVETKAVTRLVKTSTQTKKSRTERWKNVERIFETSQSALSGKHVLVVDDVITTGATLESCVQSILDAGAKKVSAGCLAMA